MTVSVRPEAAEAAADILRAHAPAGVSLEPPFETIDEDGGVEFDDATPVIVRAWLPGKRDANRGALTTLRKELRTLGDAIAQPLRTRTVSDTSWENAWKRYFTVLRIGKHLVLRPIWRRHRARRQDIVIDLDPGRAFGTGQHSTTRMCLEALERRMTAGALVLDLGSGSGILAVAAALLGAGAVDAVDIDPTAVQVTNETAERNGVATQVRAAEGSLGATWPFAESAARRYDVILANLSSRVVQELASPLVGALRAGGVALVSGIIEEKEAACREALAAAGGQVIEGLTDEGWLLLTVDAERA